MNTPVLFPVLLYESGGHRECKGLNTCHRDGILMKGANPHYENLPMQYTAIFIAIKKEYFQQKNFDIFLIFTQNIDRGYTLEPPCRGGSNEYPQSLFWSKKNRYTPAYPSFAI